MPGSGVRSSNIIEIAQQTGAVEFHSSAKKLVKSNMDFHNPSLKEELLSISADEEEITKMKALLDEYFAKKING